MKTLSKVKENLLRILTALILAVTNAYEDAKSGFLLFASAKRGASDYTAPVMVVIAGIIWIICIPIYVTEVQDTNTTGWSFTGATGAITLFNLMPFIFIAGGVVWILRKVLKG